jgi:hypothetical protein
MDDQNHEMVDIFVSTFECAYSKNGTVNVGLL